MNAPNQLLPKTDFSGLRSFAMAASLTFALGCLALPFLGDPGTSLNPIVRMRTGIITDIVREMPIGRELMFSSLALPPMPTVAGLLFAYLLGPGNPAASYYYGILLLVSLGTGGLARFLWQRGFTSPIPVALLAALGIAYWPGLVNPDLAAGLMLVLLALVVDFHARPGHRALAGFIYALAALTHPLAGLIMLCKIAWLVYRRYALAGNPEPIAVGWVQAFSMAYVATVYFGLSWIVLGQPLLPIRNFKPAPRIGREAATEIDRDIETMLQQVGQDYSGYALIADGPWGYLLDRFEQADRWHRIAAFGPDRIPAWEKRELILVVPARHKPLAGLAATAADSAGQPARGLLLEQTEDWRIYRVLRR